MIDPGTGTALTEALSEPSTEHGRWLWLWFKGHGHDGLAFLRAILSIEAEARSRPGTDPAGLELMAEIRRTFDRLDPSSPTDVGWLLRLIVDMLARLAGEPQPYVGPDVNILGIKESPGEGDIRVG